MIINQYSILVTMNWWNDLWLNEGFASYIEYKGVEAAEPTWGMVVFSKSFLESSSLHVLIFSARSVPHCRFAYSFES